MLPSQMTHKGVQEGRGGVKGIGREDIRNAGREAATMVEPLGNRDPRDDCQTTLTKKTDQKKTAGG